MILFTILACWFSGGTAILLVNACILILIASALTLGKVMTLLELLLISVIYLYMAYAVHGMAVFSLSMFSELMVRFTPLLLVAYLTTMLASDIHYAKQLLSDTLRQIVTICVITRWHSQIVEGHLPVEICW